MYEDAMMSTHRSSTMVGFFRDAAVSTFNTPRFATSSVPADDEGQTYVAGPSGAVRNRHSRGVCASLRPTAACHGL